eukprot:TRINITY_DN16632_c0_g1_i1.p1 TRINITY_DN16632_c0_g1~~TRINITY_DN16632_c0_g1_i1.p1  ORF type:complete len:193 (+),score=51.84 TRINITY_DN16632_c0_g1_i1:1-579(+)
MLKDRLFIRALELLHSASPESEKELKSHLRNTQAPSAASQARRAPVASAAGSSLINMIESLNQNNTSFSGPSTQSTTVNSTPFTSTAQSTTAPTASNPTSLPTIQAITSPPPSSSSKEKEDQHSIKDLNSDDDEEEEELEAGSTRAHPEAKRLKKMSYDDDSKKAPKATRTASSSREDSLRKKLKAMNKRKV